MLQPRREQSKLGPGHRTLTTADAALQPPGPAVCHHRRLNPEVLLLYSRDFLSVPVRNLAVKTTCTLPSAVPKADKYRMENACRRAECDPRSTCGAKDRVPACARALPVWTPSRGPAWNRPDHVVLRCAVLLRTLPLLLPDCTWHLAIAPYTGRAAVVTASG
jgi:hypothetical protein